MSLRLFSHRACRVLVQVVVGKIKAVESRLFIPLKPEQTFSDIRCTTVYASLHFVYLYPREKECE